jgi:glycerol-3-phosphate O-acyltransferase
VRLNVEQADIVAEVVENSVERLRREASRGGYAALEYVLNEAAFLEIRRLERAPAAAADRERLPAWKALAARLGRMSEPEKLEQARVLVREYAHDVSGRFDERIFRFVTGVLPAVLGVVLSPQSLGRTWTGMSDLARRFRVEGPLDRLWRCARRGTLVVAPTHSSNLDSAALGWSLHVSGLPPVVYGAGKNLFSNKFIGFFLRNLGAYRVDRRLAHALYKDVLKTYSTVLLRRGFHSLFFPGGTRSRSGAVESRLKLGLLSTPLAAYQDHLAAGEPDRRLYVVPVTINYSITLEAETLIDDHLAEEGKQRYIIDDDEFSRVRPLFGFLRRVLSLDGSLFIRYGSPLDPFGNAVDDDGESVDPNGRRIDPARYVSRPGGRPEPDPQRDAEYTRGLGEELVRAYRRLSVVMPTWIVARVLFDRVAGEDGARDIYRFLRDPGDASVPIATLVADIERWRHALGLQTGAANLLDEALTAYLAFHHCPVAERERDRIRVRHPRLLYYYRNRTSHLASPDAAGAPPVPARPGAGP